MNAVDVFFYVFSAIAVAFALCVVLGKNPISSAFSLVLVFFCVSADYVLLQAHLVAAIQILVYAGDIMVLFVFVIMVLNADIRNVDLGKSRLFQAGAAALCATLMAMFIWSIQNGAPASTKSGFTPEKIESLG